MSLKTWKQEFYPCDAISRKAAKDPIAHSLRKWEGLLKKNMRAHDVRMNGAYVGDGNGHLRIDAYSCALCQSYYNVRDDECSRCPIFKATGDDCLLVFDAFFSRHDARPMVNLLRKTKKFSEKEMTNG